MILIISLYALLASTFTIGKIALTFFQPLFFIAIRMILGGAFLLGYLYFFKRHKFSLNKKDFGLFLQTIMFHIFLAFAFEFWALQYLTSSKACLLYNTSPFLAALFSYFIFNEQMTFKKFIGLSIGFLGFLPILLSEGTVELQEGAIGYFSLPELALLGSVVSSVYGWMVVRKLVKHREYSPFMVNGVAMIGGGLISLVASCLFEQQKILVASSSDLLVGFGYILLLILIANVIYYNFYSYLLRFYSATLLSFAGFTCPLFAALFGWLFLGETIGWSFFATIFIIFWGLYLFYQEELRQGYINIDK